MFYLYMDCYFIYSNIKVNPFILQDQPYYGFSRLTWDTESWTYGTLWDIGVDAGYTKIGKGQVYGQLWTTEDHSKIRELESIFGVEKGLMEPTEVEVIVQPEPLLKEKIKAVTFQLTSILNEYKIVNDGKWLIKRSST